MFVKAILKYDPQKIDFSGYRIINGEYKEMKVNESNDKKEEELELIFQLEKEKTFNNERLVQLDFDTIQGGEIAKIDFIQAESLVIVKGEEDEHNILGKTTGVKFLTKHPKVKTAVDCYAFEDKNPVDIVAWQEVVGSYSSSSEKNYWQDIDDENSFICGSGNGSIYFLLARLGEENLKVIEKATLNIQKHGENGINKLSSEKVFGWEENDVDFSVFEFKPVVEISDAENFFIEFFGSQYAVRWPTAEGFGRMEFGN